jgi:hypothetical protein
VPLLQVGQAFKNFHPVHVHVKVIQLNERTKLHGTAADNVLMFRNPMVPFLTGIDKAYTAIIVAKIILIHGSAIWSKMILSLYPNLCCIV